MELHQSYLASGDDLDTYICLECEEHLTEEDILSYTARELGTLTDNLMRPSQTDSQHFYWFCPNCEAQLRIDPNEMR